MTRALRGAAGPLLLLWLAAHAALLALILCAKFLTAKTVTLLFLAGDVLAAFAQEARAGLARAGRHG